MVLVAPSSITSLTFGDENLAKKGDDGLMAEAGGVLISVEPDLLGQVLTEILGGVGVDRVVNLSGRDLPGRTPPRYCAAVVSQPLPEDSIAEVVILLPPAGEVYGEVRQGSRAHPVSITGTRDILDLLDRYCPAARVRATAGW